MTAAPIGATTGSTDVHPGFAELPNDLIDLTGRAPVATFGGDPRQPAHASQNHQP